jgi:hypothetical protein
MSDIFEPSIEDLKLEIEKLKGTPKPKEKKKRKELSEATKERLRKQLAKGRATSLAKRRANRELKRLAKAKDIVSNEDDIILSTKTNKELQDELKALKEELKNKTSKKLETIHEQLSDDEEEVIEAPIRQKKIPKEQPKKHEPEPEEEVEQQHIELPKKEIKEVDPMEAWLKKRKQSKYT